MEQVGNALVAEAPALVRQLGDVLAHVAVRLGLSSWMAPAVAREAHERTRPPLADR
jgi:hypothetical protein